MCKIFTGCPGLFIHEEHPIYTYIYMYIARCNAILMALHPIGAQDKIIEIKILSRHSKKWTDFLGIFQRD